MSKLSIEDIKTPSDEEWDLIWQSCDFSTYFHSREWAEIWKVYTKDKMSPCPKLTVFSDGKKALIPLSVQLSLKGLVKTYVSSPAGTFGGWITTDKLEIDHANLLVNYLLEECPNLFWRMNPYDELTFKLKMNSAVDDETYAIDLSPGYDAAYKKWKSDKKSRVKRAFKTGFIVRHATTLEDWDFYYEIYEDSLRRWGKKATSFYSKDLFKELFCRRSPYIKLWLAEHEGKIVAGDMYFYAKKHVAGWHAVAVEKYFITGVVNLLTYEAFKDACENGYSWFDLNPCGGHEGVRTFKKGFGTTELSSPIVNIETSPQKIFNKISRIARK